MAYTAADITTKVQQRVRDTGYSTIEIRNYLNDTLRDIHNEYPSLPFWKASEDYTVTAADSDITHGVGLPTDFSTPIQLTDRTSGHEMVIPYVDEADLGLVSPDFTDSTVYQDGQPQCWYYDGTTIRLFPAPAGAYTLRLSYYKNPATLTADSDVPSLPEAFEEILVVGAAYRVLQVKGVYDEAGILENKYQELLQKLVDKSMRTVRPHIMKTNRTGYRASSSIDSWHRIGR